MSHYTQEKFAESYESAFFYSHKDYMAHLLHHTLVHLELPNVNVKIVDLGGGTGKVNIPNFHVYNCKTYK